MKKLTKEEWIKKALLSHGDKYDYSKVEYIDAKTKVCIICPKHGEFWLNPNQHANGRKNGCPECSKESKKSGTEDFIEKAKKVHGNRYDYSKSIYIMAKEKVEIICPKHGPFWQIVNSHLQGEGCPECKKDKLHNFFSMNLNEFVEKAIKVHGNKYKYDKVNYINNRTKIIITCPIHGEFEQTPSSHLSGAGCPKCGKIQANSKLESIGEQTIKLYLDKHYIKYSFQYPIDIDKNINFSGNAFIDFYLPDYNLFIEYNGKLHYVPIEYFGGQITFEHLLKRDLYIRNYCKENSIKLLEIRYDEDIEKVLYENLNDDCTLSISCQRK